MQLILGRGQHLDPESLNRQTNSVNEMLERETPRMNAIVAYLERRKSQNGFGEEFEVTLRPRGKNARRNEDDK